MRKKYQDVSGTYYTLSRLVGKKEGLPPLSKRMQASVNRILETYGRESEEYLLLAEKIVYVGGECMINYVGD
jgi:hypothetical protein